MERKSPPRFLGRFRITDEHDEHDKHHLALFS